MALAADVMAADKASVGSAIKARGQVRRSTYDLLQL
jgi:hypothetical protein